ncbi:MAG: hypothetical protein AAGU21_16050 [Solidesulfovibrio sp.]|uniref:hypothetical protein n=1 Tax=Solidesulfovibrio sp. TaxID=2910990 RepID=UPI002B1F323F|nr:hypothetical protein [Solidesulfovibrio sp.]MEA4856387.1 hypothetical protein [Solidesulfovibrio sp.]
MPRLAWFLVVVLAGLWAALAPPAPSSAQSQRAQALRRDLGYVPYSPSAAFLGGYFIADEARPAFLFGPVADFVAKRGCPVAWLVEEGELSRLKARDPANPLFEYTLVLEEDCPESVSHYVFVDQSAMTPGQWIEWRRQFHKNKAEPEYADAAARLGKAVADGFPVSGELRFVLRDGSLDPASPQAVLPTALACPPRYDCDAGKPLP